MSNRSDSLIRTMLSAIAVLIATGAVEVSAETLRVPSEFPTIQAGIDAAQDGDVVLVADGVYTGDGNRDLDFGGKLITVSSENGPDNCIIDCQATSVDPHRGFFFHSGETRAAVVEGFTVRNGVVTPESPGRGHGGAIACLSSSPTVRNCHLVANTADERGGPTNVSGGGIFADESSSPMIVGCTIRENIATGAHWVSGGGIDCSGRTIISDCIIAENESIGFGGGISSWGGNPTIRSCIIEGNSSYFPGGGCFFSSSNPMILNCTIRQNWSDGNRGGGIYFDSGSVSTVADCNIRDNRARNGGGVYCDSDSTVTMRNCTFLGNRAEDPVGNRTWGGAVYCGGTATVILTNCTTTGNEAERGRFLACAGNDSPANVQITNCIGWNGGYEILNDNESNLTISYSDIRGGWTGQGNIDQDPLFAFANDVRLTAQSPCIDTGTNNPPGGLPSTDPDGNPRPLDGDGDGEAIADMGVYEFDANTPSIALAQTQFAFSSLEDGANPDDQVLRIRNAGGATLHWEIVPQCDWLEAIPGSGESNGEIDEIALHVNAEPLSHGLYACEILVVDNQAPNSPRMVNVVLEVYGTLPVPGVYPTIQAAIDDAVNRDVVLVADGVYTGTGNKNLNFGGLAITVRSENGPDNCIIDCQGSGRAFLFESGETASAVVAGLTITGGVTNSRGGAIACWDSNPTITNCTIIKNRASDGGGISCVRSSPTIIGCRIRENEAESIGGGIYARPDEGNPTILNCIISDNVAGNHAGGISAGLSSTIQFCIISGNVADSSGGGIRCRGNTTISDCIISNNSAGHGGGIVCSSERPTIRNCTIVGNSSRGRGGGIYTYLTSAPTVSNSIILGNFTQSYEGGGIYSKSRDLMVLNCTIVGNSAVTSGGGIGCWGPEARAVLSNCILWNDSAPSGAEIALRAQSTLTVSYSDVQGGQTGAEIEDGSLLIWEAGNIETDPLFVDPDDDDYHLSPGSPCIDAADNLGVPFQVTTDLDRLPRFMDDLDTPDTGNGLCFIVDMGSYEFLGLRRGDIDRNGSVNLFDFDLFLDCFSGPGGGRAPQCECADLDEDGDVDWADYGTFQRVFVRGS